MNPSDPIAALEIGTTRTVIAIAEPLGDGRIHIAAYDGIPSSGVRKSQIVDVAQARYSVASVQKKLVTQYDYAVAQAYLVISGPQIRTQETVVQVPLPRGTVGDEDVEAIGERMYDITLPAERQALEVARLSYGLDDIENISSPRGMSGHILKLRTLCIHGSAQRIADAKSAAEAAKLEILDVCYAGTSAAAAVLTAQQKRDGALVIDLGGGSTNFTAWADGRLLYADVVGVGGDHVTEDIRTGRAAQVLFRIGDDRPRRRRRAHSTLGLHARLQRGIHLPARPQHRRQRAYERAFHHHKNETRRGESPAPPKRGRVPHGRRFIAEKRRAARIQRLWTCRAARTDHPGSGWTGAGEKPCGARDDSGHSYPDHSTRTVRTLVLRRYPQHLRRQQEKMNILPSPLLLLGVGGAGAAMLRGVLRAYGPGVRALAIDTDAQSGGNGDLPFLLLGGNRLAGRGTGGQPASARAAFQDTPSILDTSLDGVRTVVIVTALGEARYSSTSTPWA